MTLAVDEPKFSGRRVLVCNDERHIVRLIQVNLQRQGYEVACACSGEEAVAMLERQAFDLVILDLHMPGRMGGCEVLAWIRTNETRKDTFVWLQASEEEANAYAPCREHRADRYAEKPFRFWDWFKR